MNTEEILKGNLWSKIGDKKWAKALVYFSVIFTLLSPVAASVGYLHTVGNKALSYLFEERVTVQEKAKFTSAYWAGKDILSARFLYGHKFEYNDIGYLHSYTERVTHLGCNSKYLDYKKLLELETIDRMQVINDYRSSIEGCLKSNDLGLYSLYKLGENILILESYLFKNIEYGFHSEPLEFEIDSINKYWSMLSSIKGIKFETKKLIESPESKSHLNYLSSYKESRERLWSELEIIM